MFNDFFLFLHVLFSSSLIYFEIFPKHTCNSFEFLDFFAWEIHEIIFWYLLTVNIFLKVL